MTEARSEIVAEFQKGRKKNLRAHKLQPKPARKKVNKYDIEGKEGAEGSRLGKRKRGRSRSGTRIFSHKIKNNCEPRRKA